MTAKLERRQGDQELHGKIEELLAGQREMAATIKQVKSDVAEQGRDLKDVKQRQNDLDLNGSAATLREMARPDGPVTQLMRAAPILLNLVPQTEDEVSLRAEALKFAPDLLAVLPAASRLGGMLEEYEQRERARKKKQEFRAEVWNAVARPFRRYRRLGVWLGPVALTVFGAIVDRLIWHLF